MDYEEIAGLKAENAKLRNLIEMLERRRMLADIQITTLTCEKDESVERVKLLEEALRPFADLWKQAEDQDKSISFVVNSCWYRPCDDLQKAFIVLNKNLKGAELKWQKKTSSFVKN